MTFEVKLDNMIFFVFIMLAFIPCFDKNRFKTKIISKKKLIFKLKVYLIGLSITFIKLKFVTLYC